MQREEINKIYRESLPKSIQMQRDYQDWRFNILVPVALKKEILNRLFAKVFFASSHYHSANRLFDTEEYKNSDRLFCQVINLFNDKYYTKEKAIKTCKIINEVMNNQKFTPPRELLASHILCNYESCMMQSNNHYRRAA